MAILSKKQDKVNVRVWPKGNLVRTSEEVCTSYKLFQRQFIKVTGEYTYVGFSSCFIVLAEKLEVKVHSLVQNF